jgi:uncharacterized protein
MPYNILSLDGGGSWALIQVQVLIDLYGANTRGQDVLRRFDLVAANSGGSLVLAGLVENKTLSEIQQMFLNQQLRGSIFSPTSSIVDRGLELTLGIGPKYSAVRKLTAIEKLLPNYGARVVDGVMTGIAGPLGNDVHLLIIAFDYDTNRACFFRSATASADGGEWGSGAPAEITLAGAVHASTNAPVNYFDAPAELPLSPDRYWDGGVTGCNNPILAATVEAVTLGIRPQDIRALSLGTGTVNLPLAPQGAPSSPFLQPRQDSSLTADLRKLASAILDDPPDIASFIAHVLSGGKAGLSDLIDSRIVRLSPVIRPAADGSGQWRAPNGWTPAQFAQLCQTGMDAVDQTDVEYIVSLAASWMNGVFPNQPIRSDSSLRPEIGYDTYRRGKAAWLSLSAPAPALVA